MANHNKQGDIDRNCFDRNQRQKRIALTKMVPSWCSSVSGPVDVIAPFDVVAIAANVEFAGDTDVVVVDSVETVIDELDSKWWWFSKLVDVFEMDVALLLWLLFVIDADEDVFALLPPLFRVARFVARADIRRFRSSRNSDFSGDTYTHTHLRSETKQTNRMNEW